MEKLNCKSLMIGDWVLDGTKKAQITSITCDGIIETTASEYTNIELIEPIPITPEILLKNGFMESRQGDWFFVIENKNNETLGIISHFPSYRLEIESWDDLIGSFESGGIKYIHQLQHAMRLCGIEKEIKL